MKTLRTLILTRHEIEKLVDMKKAISAVEMAFSLYGNHRAQMPSKIYLHLDRYNGDFRAMPGYLERVNACAVKWVNVHPDNLSKGLPTVMATVILSDPKSGFPLAVMDGTLITNLRTGAAGAVAAKYLARRDSRVVGLIGCGEQARTQLAALCEVIKINEVIVWGHQKSLCEKFVRTLRSGAYHIRIENSVKACVNNCDIVVTTTPSRKPLVKLAWLKRGAHINAIGADARGKQELDPAILKKARLVIDDWVQASHSGEINVAVSKGIISRRDIGATLPQIINGRKKGRRNAQEITVFDSTGLAIQDAALASLVYKAAIRHRLGTRVNLMGI